jgi:hypothetical protein
MTLNAEKAVFRSSLKLKPLIITNILIKIALFILSGKK